MRQNTASQGSIFTTTEKDGILRARYVVENYVLPKLFLRQGEEFLDVLTSHGVHLLSQYYNNPLHQAHYKPEEFSLTQLFDSRIGTIVRIDAPKAGMQIPFCYRIYLINSAHSNLYITIEHSLAFNQSLKQKRDSRAMICGITFDERKQQHHNYGVSLTGNNSDREFKLVKRIASHLLRDKQNLAFVDPNKS